MSPLLALYVAALALAGAPEAPVPQADDPDIIVEGERPQDRAAVIELGREAAGYPNLEQPLARFQKPLCLLVAGEDTALATAIAQRVIDNAKRAGVETGDGRCKPNALIVFTDDARGQLKDLRKKDKLAFADLAPRHLDSLLASRDPAFAIHATEFRRSDGMVLARDDRGRLFNSNAKMSRLIDSVREDLFSAMVVIDSAASASSTPQQLADYASLRLLAPTGELRTAPSGAPGTILSLFMAPEAAPLQMTAFDRAYLDTLYRLPPNSFARQVLRETARSMDRSVTDDSNTAQK